MDNNIYYAVNEYLALWDPIGLPPEIASVEYVDYVPDVVDALTDRKKLAMCLMAFLDETGINKDNRCINLDKEISMRITDLLDLTKISRSHDIYLKILETDPLVGFRMYYIVYDDEKKCVCRKIEVGKSGEVLNKADYNVSNGIEKISHLTIRSIIERFNTEFVSQEEFESVWNLESR